MRFLCKLAIDGGIGDGRLACLMNRKNRRLEEFERVLYGDRWVSEELWGWYQKERPGEEADEGKER